MPTMSAYLTRAELGLPDLSLTSASLQLDEEGPTGVGLSWRRNTVTSPFVDGEFEVSAVQDAGQINARVWAMGLTSMDVKIAVRELLAAVQQTTYEFHWTSDDFAWGFTACMRADYTIGMQSGYVRGLVVPVSLSIPHNPW